MTFLFENERITALSPEGLSMGYIIFPRIKAGLVNISQMMVFPAFRGMDVENAMLESLLVHLDKLHLKAALTCPFAQQYVGKNPRWKHLLPEKMHFTAH